MRTKNTPGFPFTYKIQKKRLKPGFLLWTAIAFLMFLDPSISLAEERTVFRESVTLNTDHAVARKMESVQGYLKAERWEEAVEFLQEILDQHSDTLIPIEQGRYLDVKRYCHLMATALPPEARKIFREKITTHANQLFLQAKEKEDLTLLEHMIRRYYISSQTDEALMLAGELSWEQGNLFQARQYWKQLLPFQQARANAPLVLRYPDPDFSIAEIQAKIILSLLIEGKLTEGKKEWQAFHQQFPKQQGYLAGRNGTLSDILKDVLNNSRKWSFPVQKTRFETWGGSTQRTGLMDAPISVGAPLWSVGLNASFYLDRESEKELSSGLPLSYYPVFWKEKIFLTDGMSIWGYNLKTGRPAFPLSDQDTNSVIYPDLPEPVRLPIRPVVGVSRYSLTIDRGWLYARMGSPVTGKALQELRSLKSRIVRLPLEQWDQVTPEGKWPIDAASVYPDEENWAFEGTPVVRGNRLFVGMSRSHPEAQRNVVCFHSESGEQLWSRNICATVPSIDESFNVVSHRLITLGEDLLFYSTDSGAIAALEQSTGLVRWVVTYESHPPEGPGPLSDHLYWGMLPPLYYQGTVIVAPNDANEIMGIDAEEGYLKWKRRLPDRIRHLLGVTNETVIASGNSLWSLQLETGEIHWKHHHRDPEFFGFGRGLLTEKEVWWPTRDSIYRISSSSGRLVSQPVSLRQKGGKGGHLFLYGGKLVVIEPLRMIVYDDQAREIKPPTRGLSEVH